jgi:hypothetical protein
MDVARLTLSDTERFKDAGSTGRSLWLLSFDNTNVSIDWLLAGFSRSVPRTRREGFLRTFGGEGTGLEGIGAMPVTNLQKAAMALKQNFAGVVKEKSTVITWGASGRHNPGLSFNNPEYTNRITYHHKPGDELLLVRGVYLLCHSKRGTMFVPLL